MNQILGDAQTTITAVVGGVGGAGSTLISNKIIAAVTNNSPPSGLGAVGLEFCGRAVVSAAMFAMLQSYMPQTSGNVFFTFLYFSADTGLVFSGLAISRGVVNAISSIIPSGVASRSTAPSGPAYSGDCATCQH